MCACTEEDGDSKGGCAKPNKDLSEVKLTCAIGQARTDVNLTADKLGGPLGVTVSDQMLNVTWVAPLKPNAAVLKYDILV